MVLDNSDPERLTQTIPEAAKVLGITVQTAYVWARRGDIPVIKIGGRLLVKRMELERMLGKPTALQAEAE